MFDLVRANTTIQDPVDGVQVIGADGLPTATFTHQQIWEALDEIDSTGELILDQDLLEHLKQRNLVEYDEVDCVYYVSGDGWEVYEKGWSSPC